MSILDRFRTQEHLSDEEFSAAVDGLSEPAAASHLLSCARCRVELGRWNQLLGGLRELDPCPQAREAMISAALDAVGSAPSLLSQPSAPGSRDAAAPVDGVVVPLDAARAPRSGIGGVQAGSGRVQAGRGPKRRRLVASLVAVAAAIGLLFGGAGLEGQFSGGAAHPAVAAQGYTTTAALRGALLQRLGSPPSAGPRLPCRQKAVELMASTTSSASQMVLDAKVRFQGRDSTVFVFTTGTSDRAVLFDTTSCAYVTSFEL